MTDCRFVVRIVSAMVTLVLVSGCGSGDDGSSGAGSPDRSVAAASAPDPAGAIEIIAGAPGAAGAAGCDTTRGTLQLAVETYVALLGEPPTGQSDLIDAQIVREPSPWFDITADGEIVPSPESPCS
jgi:hypothetical protein